MDTDKTLFPILIIVSILILMVIPRVAEGNSFVPDTVEKQEALANAIYKAEGGKNTNYPFGIKSVKCAGYQECRVICLNTIKNNIKRWETSKSNGDDRDYLTFLWHRYCPPQLNKLNENWKKNVEFFLEKEV